MGQGGIFAMIVDTLELKSDIDVTGTGFRGGDPSKDTSKGYCINSTIDTLDFLEPNYPFSAKDTAGLKGESVVVFDSLYMRGLKYLYNGGGGGPGYHSGGGGGGNFGSGGSGGGQACKCYPNCADSLINTKMLALGGYRLDGGLLDLGDVRAVFGGGGGCGTRAIITDTSKAGNGGGLVLLIANVVKGNGHSIKADGQTVTDISIIGGGGGGGGGAVLLDVNNFEGKLTVSVKGGSGGWTEGSTDAGPGGGGGCGYIWYNGTTIPPSDSITNSYYPGGSSGKNLYFRTTRWASPGEYGTIKGNLIMPLSNFLFNLMPSDTIICAGDVPHVFNASHPKGGDGNYKYTWLKSTDKLHFSIIQGAVSMTYQETALFDTTYYLRIVRVLNPYFGDTIVDQSQDTLKVFVLPVIDNNKIFSSDTAKCYGIPLPNLTGTFPFGTDTMKLSGGNGSYIYQWQVYNSNWISAPNDSNKINYSPKQTYSIKVRRFIKSSACNSISNSINLTVLPAITNNVIANTQWICKGSLKPDSLYGINPIGGGDTIHHQYIYLWQGSSNNFSSVDTSLTQSGAKYHFSKALPDTMYYRRIVFSGQLNTCKDTSNILAINILDSIENNFIHEVDTVICGNTRPKEDFFGDLPTGGDKKYRYQWDSITTSKP